MTRHSTPDGRRVLAVRADSMGDVLLTGPAIRALGARARVTVLAGPSGTEAARALPAVERVLVHELPWIVADPGPCTGPLMEALVDDVRTWRFHEAVIFTSFHQSPLPMALLLRIAGVTRISAISDDYPGALLDVRHQVSDAIHEVDRARSLAAAAGFPAPPGDDGRLAIRRAHRPGPRRGATASASHRPTVVVHPGASVPARAWAPERARGLVHTLTATGIDVVVTGGPAERALTAYVAGTHRGVRDAGGATTLDALADEMERADVVVCGNTGPAHLAAAVGTPVVSLYAPTVPAVRWRPWGVPHVLLGDQHAPCRGCRARRCPKPGHPCLDVAVSDVVRAVERLVARPPWVGAA